jgi:multicomponent Na+:H+ antiporter subunit C
LLLDPLPQAFVLTAIVITFGVTGFLLALAYRSWALTHDDEVQDDVEDRLVARRTEAEDVEDARAAAAEIDELMSDSEFGDEAAAAGREVGQ